MWYVCLYPLVLFLRKDIYLEQTSQILVASLLLKRRKKSLIPKHGAEPDNPSDTLPFIYFEFL